MLYMCLLMFEGADSDSDWLYSSDPHASANAPCRHVSTPCRHMMLCQHECGHPQHHQAYYTPPASPYDSATGWPTTAGNSAYHHHHHHHQQQAYYSPPASTHYPAGPAEMSGYHNQVYYTPPVYPYPTGPSYPGNAEKSDHSSQAYYTPQASTSESAAAVEKTDVVTAGQPDAQHQKLQVGDDELPREDGTASDSAMFCVTCDLDYYVVEYITKCQVHRIKSIEQEFGVTIKSVNRVCEEIVTVAFQRYNPVIQTDNEEKAHRAFLALYEVVYRHIVQRTVHANINPPSTASSIISAIDNVYKQEIFVSASPDGVFTLVGPFEQVSAVENYLLRRHANRTAGHSDDHEHGDFHEDDNGEEFPTESGGGGNAVGGSRGPMSVFEVGGQLTVKVYSADITRVSLDVIVNAANEHLQNYAGVAGAIERAGGDELKQDCEAVVQQGGPLKVSLFFSSRHLSQCIEALNLLRSCGRNYQLLQIEFDLFKNLFLDVFFRTSKLVP